MCSRDLKRYAGGRRNARWASYNARYAQHMHLAAFAEFGSCIKSSCVNRDFPPCTRHYMDLQGRVLQLKQLILDIDTRLDALERRFTSRGGCKGTDAQHQVNANAASAQFLAHLSLKSQRKRVCCGQESAYRSQSASCTESRLAKELLERGITKFCFKRVPEHYYAEDLEYRCNCLQAASIQHLCKSLLYENPKLPADLECQDLRHCLVIVQVWFAVLIRNATSVASMSKGGTSDLQNPRPGCHPTSGADNLLGHCSILQSCMVKS